MNVAVLLKLVSQARFTDSLCDVGDRLSSGQLVMNPADEYALELALRLRDACPGTRVTALTMSPAAGGEILRRALAMGADEAVHLCDPAFSGADTLVTADVLAAALRLLPPQKLIVCGQRAIDSETGHIGPQLAARLGLPAVTNVLTFRRENGAFAVRRLQDSGIARLTCGSAVLTVCRGTEMVRLPDIADLRAARDKPLRLVDSGQLPLAREALGAAGSPTQVLRTAPIRHRTRAGTDCGGVREGAAAILRLAGRGAESHG